MAVAPDDAELVHRIGVGDSSQEAVLFRKFAPRIRLFGLRHLRDEHAADDLVQQVIVTVLESVRAGKMREPERLGSFVLGTARLVAKGLKTGEYRRQGLLDRFGPKAADYEAGESTSSLDTEQLRRCVEGLPPRERTVVMLTFYAERSGDEIAAELGMTAGNVRVVRHRAIGRLQECMGAGEATA
jgi:RNA polymerase sigma-70 factor (ECF subfamily)